MATVELEDVAKSYGGRPAVMGLSLSVASGESMALLGPSGCGKTTTLNMIAGFIDPDRGALRIGGRSMTGVPPYRRRIGVVFQSYALFPHLDVFDNLAFGLRMHGETKTAIAAGVRLGLDLVQLAGLERRYPRELSGGQQQRVALARALVWRPSVLLLDEPLSNLDPTLREKTRRELRRAIRKIGITTLFVTHEQEEAFELGDRVAVLCDGRLEQIGTPEELFERPATRFVATFIGRSSVVPVRWDEKAGGARIPGGPVWPARAAVALADGADGDLVARPESMALAAASFDDAIPATVVERRFAGRFAYYVLAREADGELEVLAEPDAAREGDRVHVRPSAEGPIPLVFPRAPRVPTSTLLQRESIVVKRQRR